MKYDGGSTLTHRAVTSCCFLRKGTNPAVHAKLFSAFALRYHRSRFMINCIIKGTTTSHELKKGLRVHLCLCNLAEEKRGWRWVGEHTRINHVWKTDEWKQGSSRQRRTQRTKRCVVSVAGKSKESAECARSRHPGDKSMPFSSRWNFQHRESVPAANFGRFSVPRNSSTSQKW